MSKCKKLMYVALLWLFLIFIMIPLIGVFGILVGSLISIGLLAYILEDEINNEKT